MNSASFYKSRAYFLICPFHKKRKKKKILTNSKARRKLEEMGVEMFISSNFNQLAKEIRNFNFTEYASLLIFAEFTCFHYETEVDYPLEPIYKAIERNPTLKCVTKLLMCFSTLQAQLEWTEVIEGSDIDDDDCNSKLPHDLQIPFYDLMNTDFDINTTYAIQSESDIRTRIYYKPDNDNECEDVAKKVATLETMSLTEMFSSLNPGDELIIQIHPPKDQFLEELQASEDNFKPNIDNFTYIQCLQKEFSTSRTFVNMIYDYMINYAYEKPVQEIAKMFCSDICSERYSDQAYYNTTCSGAGYIFQMNPALTFMIINLKFPQVDLIDRPNSKHDISRVQETFLKKKIQFYALCDGSLADIQALLHKLRTTNFSWLKYLYIFISSHGDIGDIIYTTNGTYSIQDDIVKALVANGTLKDVQKFILVNACRGETDPTKIYRVEEIKELMQQSNDKEKLEYFHDEKLMIIYSTQKGFVSLLYPDGAIFLQTFCEVFEENFDETSMEIIGQKIIDKMNEYIGDDQVPDFGPCNNLQHNIKMEFVNSFDNRKALKNMARFFRRKFQQNPDILDVRKRTIQS